MIRAEVTDHGQPFGQSEPLTIRLRNLVRNYPKGLGIFKEFIQNADDAEADEIIFVIDEQRYSTEGLPSAMQWLNATPSLLVYNNMSFSDDDIKGIQSLGDSVKSASVGKTGRFGLGFNACYNITDVPTLLTRDSLYIFDPHLEIVPSSEKPGRQYTIDFLLSKGWPLLDAFQPFYSNGKAFNETVFRLPFRTAQQAEVSQIKKDAYAVSDALDAVRELQEMSSAILLFLKYLKRLTVKHRGKDGTVETILTIEASNYKEIFESRLVINDLLNSPDEKQILKTLSQKGEVYSSCTHEYRIATRAREYTEAWRVVDGFFVDDGKAVINACRDMLRYGEKALPYAGAAWRIDKGQQPAGRIFCFLPVPMHTSMPIQLNGYFDLDDSRQNMFLDLSAHGRAGLRVKWNKMLLENSVVQACIRLLKDLRSDLGKDFIDLYYKAFPKVVDNGRGWEGWLTKSFYEQAAGKRLFRVAGNTWSKLSGIRILPKGLRSVEKALIEEGFLPIPDPRLPVHIIKGFTVNGIDIPQLKPGELRARLKVQVDVDCEIASAKRCCLRKRSHVEQILSFCLSDNPENNEVCGLPLVIDTRGYLRTLGKTESPLYLAEYRRDIEVFMDYPDWFVEWEFAYELKLSEMEDIGLLKMDSTRFQQELAKYVSGQEINSEIKMSAAKTGPFTDRWLQAAFDRLLNSDLDESIITGIPLIPDQSNVFRVMGNKSTPLLYRMKNKDLKQALLKLSVPLVIGVSNDLFDLLVGFSENKGYLRRLTPQDLIDTLESECLEELDRYEKCTDIHRSILQYLSRDSSINLLKGFQDQRDALKKMKLFPTVNGTVVNIDRKAYIAQEYKFPSIKLDVIMLDDGPSHKWRELYVLLGIKELSRSRLIRDVLLEEFKELYISEQARASLWLRNNLQIAMNESSDVDSDELMEKVRYTDLIICEDGKLRSPSRVYRPDSRMARDVFGKRAPFPFMEVTYKYKSERWLEFFAYLKMPTEPRFSDIYDHLRALLDDPSAKNKPGHFQTVYGYLKDCVENDLQQKKVISDELSDLLEELAEMAWVPVRQKAGDLLCFRTPKVAFARPGEVYFPRFGQLVASQAYITFLKPEPKRSTGKEMGFSMEVPPSLVSRHFLTILNFYRDQETVSDKLIQALKQIYRFFGGGYNKVDDSLDENVANTIDESVDLGVMFAGKACIWDQEMQRFWLPDHVFTSDVGYMEPWRRTIRYSEDSIQQGCMALGCREKPTFEDLKQVLEDISQSDKSLSQSNVSNVVEEVLRRIVKYLNDTDGSDGTVRVPTRCDKMLPSEKVYIADAPWYESRLNSWDIPILSPSVSHLWGIQRVLGISSLAHAIKERLLGQPRKSNVIEKSRVCSRLESLIRSDEFTVGFKRLLLNEGHEVFDSQLAFLKGISVQCVQSIRTHIYLERDGQEIDLDNGEADYYYDAETRLAMLSESRDSYFHEDLAKLLNHTIENRLGDLFPLVRVLKCEPADVSRVLDDLKIRKYDYDPPEETDSADVQQQDFPNDETPDGDIAEDEDEEVISQSGDQHQENNTDHAREILTPTTSGGTGEDKPRDTHSENGDEGFDRFTVPEGPGREREKRLRKPGTSGKPGTPSRPGTSSSRAVPTDRPTVQERFYSYVSSNTTPDGTDSEDSELRKQVARAAVAAVMDYESRNGRNAKSMPHTNPGYDILSVADGEERYIEVKGTEGEWGVRGVTLTRKQFYYKKDNPASNFWLYVVENALTNPHIYRIQDPSSKVNRFAFDSGWKRIAEEDEN